MLNRNLVRRVEVFAKIRDPEIRAETLNILDAIRRDNLKAWEMLPDGSYRKPAESAAGLPPCDSQLALYAHFAEKAKKEQGAARVPAADRRGNDRSRGGFFSRLRALFASEPESGA